MPIIVDFKGNVKMKKSETPRLHDWDAYMYEEIKSDKYQEEN
jgi:hypothetical protein